MKHRTYTMTSGRVRSHALNASLRLARYASAIALPCGCVSKFRLRFVMMIAALGTIGVAHAQISVDSTTISRVWRVTQLSCNGYVAHQLEQSPDAAEIIRTSVVQIPQVQLQFAIPRTADVPARTVRLVFDDRGRKVVDHYILLSRNDVDDPVAAVMVTELPPSFDTPQKALAAAVAGERGNVEGSGARATLERISTPWGEGLDIFVPNRAGSPCFPSARYRLSSPPDAGPTIGLSRFITMPGRLIQFALILNAPPGMSAEEQKSHARQVMDVFAAGLRKL